MLSLQWLFCKLLIPDSTYFELKVLMAECVTMESHDKKSVDCRGKEQKRAFSESSFELALALWLQWFCKISFPDSTYVELKVLIAECYFGKPRKKKSVECRSKEQRRAFSDRIVSVKKSSFISNIIYLLLDVSTQQWCLHQEFFKHYRNWHNFSNCHYENATIQIVHALKISEIGVMISPFSEQYFGCWGWTRSNIDWFPFLSQGSLFALVPSHWWLELP